MHNINKKNFEKIFSKNSVEFSDELKMKSFLKLKKEFLIANGVLIFGLAIGIIFNDISYGGIFILAGGFGRLYSIYSIGNFFDNKKLFIFFIIIIVVSPIGQFLEDIMAIIFVIFVIFMHFLFYKEMTKIFNQKMFYIPFIFCITMFLMPNYWLLFQILVFITEFAIMLFIKDFESDNLEDKENSNIKKCLSNLSIKENLVINIFRILYFIAFVCLCYFAIRWSLGQYRENLFYNTPRLKVSIVAFLIIYILQIVILGQKNIFYCFRNFFDNLIRK